MNIRQIIICSVFTFCFPISQSNYASTPKTAPALIPKLFMNCGSMYFMEALPPHKWAEKVQAYYAVSKDGLKWKWFDNKYQKFRESTNSGCFKQSAVILHASYDDKKQDSSYHLLKLSNTLEILNGVPKFNPRYDRKKIFLWDNLFYLFDGTTKDLKKWKTGNNYSFYVLRNNELRVYCSAPNSPSGQTFIEIKINGKIEKILLAPNHCAIYTFAYISKSENKYLIEQNAVHFEKGGNIYVHEIDLEKKIATKIATFSAGTQFFNGLAYKYRNDYQGKNNGLEISKDLGKTWKKVTLPIDSSEKLFEFTIYTADNGVFLSSWKEPSKFYFSSDMEKWTTAVFE